MQLVMRHIFSEPLPEEIPLRLGYELRTAEVDDARGLAFLLSRAFGDPWEVPRVMTALLQAPDVRRTYVVEFGRNIVATASAQVLADQWPGSGVVHWVGADPDFAGRGLGAAVVLAVLKDHLQAGHQDVVLTTDDERLAAIRTYLKLGFQPHFCDPTHPERWQTIGRTMGLSFPFEEEG